VEIGGVVHAAYQLIPSGPSTLRELITAGPATLERLWDAACTAPHEERPTLAELDLLPSVPEPPNIIAIGRNYEEHADEEGADAPTAPEIFLKHTSSLTAAHSPIEWDPNYTSQIDWEAELGVVIARPARDVPAEEALDYVLGYTAFNDVSARDLQFGDLQWARGKSLDTFGPCGPVLVTADEIPHPQGLGIRCLLNGEVVQESNTAAMYFGVAEIISYCSRAFTLRPGDLIITGTPGGVGAFHKPPVWMRPGDVVAVEIDSIGRLENSCRERSKSRGLTQTIRRGAQGA
jgi:2-keto-4-pentenoate hydratase/2-oxohepta-3-ene-1,7-dioic acid hydratase in catechol pathway